MRKNWRNIIGLTLLLLFAAGSIALLNFAHQQAASRLCTTFSVSVDRGEAAVFITEEDVDSSLFEQHLHPIGKTLNTFSLAQVEERLRYNSAVENVEVFSDLSGKVQVTIHQRVPLLRVENSYGQQFYLDREGYVMATSRQYTSRHLIVNGAIPERVRTNQNVRATANDSLAPTALLADLYELALLIVEDPFLSALIDQIYVAPDQSFELTSKINNQRILLGKERSFQDPLHRLVLFYRYGIQKAGFQAYHTLNLSFKDQVVCVY